MGKYREALYLMAIGIIASSTWLFVDWLTPWFEAPTVSNAVILGMGVTSGILLFHAGVSHAWEIFHDARREYRERIAIQNRSF